jgi:aromatic ring-opening dioxygenase catalytic subunit (LigB family)
MSNAVPLLPRSQDEWHLALAALPETTSGGIPAFYFAHGSPGLAMSGGPGLDSHPRFNVAGGAGAAAAMGPEGPNARFLKEFGPTLLRKYKPKGIVVFSAHWDAPGDRLGT